MPMETFRFAAAADDDDDGYSVWVADYVHEVLLAAPWDEIFFLGGGCISFLS